MKISSSSYGSGSFSATASVFSATASVFFSVAMGTLLSHISRRRRSASGRIGFASVGGVRRAVSRRAHHAQQALGVQHGRAVGLELVADGAELVQRAADLGLVVHDHLQRTALRIDDAEGILAEEVGRVGRALALVLVAGAGQDGRERVLDEAHAVQLADLAVIDLVRLGVLVRLDPLFGLAQVVGDGRMDHGVILAVDGRHAVLLHLRDRLGDHVRRQVGVAVSSARAAAGAHLGAGGRRGDIRAGRAEVVAVEHVRVGQQRVADELFLRLCGARAHLLGRAEDHVVVGAQLQTVGDAGVRAVLVDAALELGHAELLARRDHAFGQLAGLLEGVPLAPLHGAAVVLRQRLLLAELGIKHLGAGVFEQLGVIKGLELRRKRVGAGEGGRRAGRGVDVVAGRVDQRARVREKLQTEHGIKNGLHKIASPFRKCRSSGRSRRTSSERVGIELLPVRRCDAHAALDIVASRARHRRRGRNGCCLGCAAVLCRPALPGLDAVADLLCGLMRCHLHRRRLDLLTVHGKVGILHADQAARRGQPREDRVLQLRLQVKARIHLLQLRRLLHQPVEMLLQSALLKRLLVLVLQQLVAPLQLVDTHGFLDGDAELVRPLLVVRLVLGHSLVQRLHVQLGDILRVDAVLARHQLQCRRQVLERLLGLLRLCQPLLHHLLRLLVVLGIRHDLVPRQALRHFLPIIGALCSVVLRLRRLCRCPVVTVHGRYARSRPLADLVRRDTKPGQDALPGVGSRYARSTCTICACARSGRTSGRATRAAFAAEHLQAMQHGQCLDIKSHKDASVKNLW
nr:MAG TPA: hypothetical protein [Caudoviricetes sp.]